jgi:DNA-binding FrmR family transcriptional regulator
MVMSPEAQKELVARMRRIEGQARGVQRMISEDRDCVEILTQLASLRSAAYSASVALAEQYAVQCLHSANQETLAGGIAPEQAIGELVAVLLRAPH